MDENDTDLETWTCSQCGNVYHWAQNVCSACFPTRVDFPQEEQARKMAKEPIEIRRKRNEKRQLEKER